MKAATASTTKNQFFRSARASRPSEKPPSSACSSGAGSWLRGGSEGEGSSDFISEYFQAERPPRARDVHFLRVRPPRRVTAHFHNGSAHGPSRPRRPAAE